MSTNHNLEENGFINIPKDSLGEYLHGGVDELTSLVEFPEMCRFIKRRDLDISAITDTETDPEKGGYDVILKFIFYHPLSTNIQLLVCFYNWSMSEHLIMMDARMKRAINVAYLKYGFGNNNEENWDLVRSYWNAAGEMGGMYSESEREQIAWYKVGFGKSTMIQTIEGKHSRSIPLPDAIAQIPDWVLGDIAAQLCIRYYSGMAPLNPELVIVQTKPQFPENKVVFVDSHLVGAYDWDRELNEPMCSHRQGLFDFFFAFNIYLRPAEREVMKQAFCECYAVLMGKGDECAKIFQKLSTARPPWVCADPVGKFNERI